jgi:hypothetical protein
MRPEDRLRRLITKTIRELSARTRTDCVQNTGHDLSRQASEAVSAR